MRTEHILRMSAGFRSKQFPVAIDAGPIAVDESHGIAADRTVRRRSFIDAREDRELNIVFVHRSLPFSRAHFKLQSFFGALSAGHTHKRQSPVDDCRGHRTNGMAVGKFLAVRRGDVDFTIGKTVFHAQLFPQAFGGRTCAAAGRDE